MLSAAIKSRLFAKCARDRIVYLEYFSSWSRI